MKHKPLPHRPSATRLKVPTGSPTDLEQGPEKCILVGVEVSRREPRAAGTEPTTLEYSTEESLEELNELAISAGATVLGSTIQARERLDPATLIGRGKAAEIQAWAEEENADFVLFDQNLSPTQQRNLERIVGRRVLDRTQLILDIFAAHARTREGQLQVELAQLNYLLPRLTGRGVEMSRLGGGIGTRGPGETQLETDRRRISRRIEKLKVDLERVRATRELQRKKRTAVPLGTVALVGYTNAGKSTLFNALTTARVLADAKMFATLDPTIRVLDLPSHRRVLLSDTVGFIRHLPPTLIKAFRATLEEVTRAAMILHVVDAGTAHWREQMQEVSKLLSELEADDKTQILLLNKRDLLDPAEVAAATDAARGTAPATEVLAISARSGQGLNALIAAIDRLLPVDEVMTERYRFSHEEGDKISFLYDHARVLERYDTSAGVEIVAEAPASVRRRLEDHVLGSDLEAPRRRPSGA